MISKKIVLHFPPQLVDRPIVSKLIRDYNLNFNILKAYVTPREEGLLVLELSGENKDYRQGIQYLKKIGVTIQHLSQDIIRNEQKCTNCGVCVPICPTSALVVDAGTRKINFYDDKCIACELCLKVCPYQAMEIHF